MINTIYRTYIVVKYKINLHFLLNRLEKLPKIIYFLTMYYIVYVINWLLAKKVEFID